MYNKSKSTSLKKSSFFSFLSLKGFGAGFLIFLLSGSMFVLGIYVGRGNAPLEFDTSTIQNEIARLNNIELQNNRIVDSDNSNIEKPELEFYKALKQTSAKPVKKAEVKKKVAEPEKSKAAEKKPVKKVKKRVIPLDRSKIFSLQVAALQNSKEAEKLVNRLLSKGYYCYKIEKKDPSGKVWFKVRVGQYADKEEASSTLLKLQDDDMDAFLVRI